MNVSACRHSVLEMPSLLLPSCSIGTASLGPCVPQGGRESSFSDLKGESAFRQPHIQSMPLPHPAPLSRTRLPSLAPTFQEPECACRLPLSLPCPCFPQELEGEERCHPNVGYLEPGQNQVELLRLRPRAFPLCQGLGHHGCLCPRGHS